MQLSAEDFPYGSVCIDFMAHFGERMITLFADLAVCMPVRLPSFPAPEEIARSYL
jgi:hypothetical protein